MYSLEELLDLFHNLMKQHQAGQPDAEASLLRVAEQMYEQIRVSATNPLSEVQQAGLVALSTSKQLGRFSDLAHGALDMYARLSYPSEPPPHILPSGRTWVTVTSDPPEPPTRLTGDTGATGRFEPPPSDGPRVRANLHQKEGHSLEPAPETPTDDTGMPTRLTTFAPPPED